MKRTGLIHCGDQGHIALTRPESPVELGNRVAVN